MKTGYPPGYHLWHHVRSTHLSTKSPIPLSPISLFPTIGLPNH